MINTGQQKDASAVDLAGGVAAFQHKQPPIWRDRIIFILLCGYILIWTPYQFLVGTRSAYTWIHQQLIGAGINSSAIDTSAVYAKLLMYGLAPAVAVGGLAALGMLLAGHKRWHVVAIGALLSKTVLIFASHPVMLSVYEIHSVELFPEFKQRMLYASIGKGVLSSLFTIPMSWYLFSSGGDLFHRSGTQRRDVVNPPIKDGNRDSLVDSKDGALTAKVPVMRLNFVPLLKRFVPAMGLFAVAACLVYVPYEAVRIRPGDNLIANIGYSFIWAPPSVEACMEHFNVGRGVCRIRPLFLPAIITAAAAAAITAGLTLIVGLLPSRNKL